MARNKLMESRVKALVAELLADEEAEGRDDGPETINHIEDAMVRIGDMVAREFGMQKLAHHTRDVCKEPACPDCGRVGQRVGDQARNLMTRRGKVPLVEAKYRCPECRRHFFPSDGGAWS